MSMCKLCNSNANWSYKDKYCSLYCNNCRIVDVAETYINSLAVKEGGKNIVEY